MAKILIKKRLAAFAWHFLFSSVLAGLLSVAVFIFWFPGVYRIFGATEGILIFIGIDVVLGPLLTFVVYKANKQEFRRDITFIIFIQISAFLFGAWTIYQQRPFVQVLDYDGLTIYTYDEANSHSISIPSAGSTNLIGPDKFFLYLPEKLSEIKIIEFVSEFVDKKPFSMRTDLYRSYSESGRWGLDNIMSRFEKDSANSCYWVNVTSKHFSGKACVDMDGELIIIN